MPKDAITLVFAFSRASVLSVRISSFVHGRSFLVGFAISAPHALCKTKKHRLKRCSLIARHDTTRTSRNHRAVDKSYAVAQAISRPAGAPTATNSDGATLQYPRRHPAPPGATVKLKPSGCCATLTPWPWPLGRRRGPITVCSGRWAKSITDISALFPGQMLLSSD
jgi:hypothetical protein